MTQHTGRDATTQFRDPTINICVGGDSSGQDGTYAAKHMAEYEALSKRILGEGQLSKDWCQALL